MDIKIELIKSYVAKILANQFQNFNIDANEIVDTEATMMLSEILIAVRDESLTDFDVVEQIVSVFEKNNITCLGRHNF